MNVTFTAFKSIQEIKDKAEHIRKGQIFPRRIVAALNKKKQHKLTSGSNQYALPTKSGYLLFVDNNDGGFDSAVHMKELISLNGSPYIPSGGTYWFGDCDLTENQFLIRFNIRYLAMNKEGE